MYIHKLLLILLIAVAFCSPCLGASIGVPTQAAKTAVGTPAQTAKITVKGSDITAAGEALIRSENTVEEYEELVISAVTTPKDIVASRGKVELKAKASGPVSNRSRVALAVNVFVDEKIVQHCIVHYRVEKMAEVLVMYRNVSRKASLTLSDVKLERKDLFTVRGNPLRSEDDLADMRTVRSLTTGMVLTDALVEPIPLVQKGQEITISVIASGVVVTAPGVALEDGAKDTMIRVRTSLSKEDFLAKVTANASVEINMSPVERASK